LGAATAAGATRQAAALGCLLGVVAGGVFVLTDPRSRLVRRSQAAPRIEPWWKAALRATYPSTLGVALLAAVSLAFSPVLAAVLAGIVGGLGVAGLLTALALRA
ncbi:MAG: hypothetical protein H0W87_01870, partial [Actinobacteria bacterium]|nr:hypothetical protein [Actinomycetota bacterium]